MSFKKGLAKYSTLFHKWLGLVIGIQVLLWVASGVIMVWWDIEVIRSEHNIVVHPAGKLETDQNIVPLNLVLDKVGNAAVGANISFLMQEPVYEIEIEGGEKFLFDAITGQQLSPLSGEKALELASYDFLPETTPAEAEWVEEHNLEYRGAVPVWKVDMQDAEGTHLYISPQTGQVVARRSDVWRLYDFFWMLHIMDYENRTNFNNPLVIWTSIFAFVFSVTGIIMLFFRFKRRDFGLGGNGRNR